MSSFSSMVEPVLVGPLGTALVLSLQVALIAGVARVGYCWHARRRHAASAMADGHSTECFACAPAFHPGRLASAFACLRAQRRNSSRNSKRSYQRVHNRATSYP